MDKDIYTYVYLCTYIYIEYACPYRYIHTTLYEMHMPIWMESSP